MTPTPLVIIGCGGFGREVYEIVTAINARRRSWQVLGFVDDHASVENLALVAEMGSCVLGSLSVLSDYEKEGALVVAVGAPAARAGIVARLTGAACQTWTYATLVHPDATLGASVSLQPGTVVAPGARVSANVRVGAHVHIDQNATVGHDCTLEDFVRVNPQACISGSVRLGAHTTVGANATVLPGLTTGPNSVVGAGAVVVRDVTADAVVKGVPAR